MKAFKRLTAIMMVAVALAVNVGAAPTECYGTHPYGYSLVDPYCAGRKYDTAGNCVLGHYYPCEVTVTHAYTGYHCSYHGNEVEPGDTHYERIKHIDGNDKIVINYYCCPYTDNSLPNI